MIGDVEVPLVSAVARAGIETRFTPPLPALHRCPVLLYVALGEAEGRLTTADLRTALGGRRDLHRGGAVPQPRAGEAEILIFGSTPFYLIGAPLSFVAAVTLAVNALPAPRERTQ